MNNKTRELTKQAILITVALILSYIETLIPAIPIPGAKIGLANLVSVLGLFLVSYKQTLIIVLLRIVLATFLFSPPSTMMYSIPAGVISLSVMALIKRYVKDDNCYVSMSIGGAITHNLVQLMIAIIVLKSMGMISLAPWLLIISLATGVFIGISTKTLYKYLPNR